MIRKIRFEGRFENDPDCKCLTELLYDFGKFYGIKMIRASICMATYNGESYLREQLDSILRQAGPDDEIVIVDDGSKDKTRDILTGYKDNRIALHFNSVNLGFCATFEKAIGLATGEYIILSDQDDIWIAGRLATMCSVLAKNHGVISSNFTFFNSNGEPTNLPIMSPLLARHSSQHYRNIIKLYFGRMQYFGSAMAFSSRLKNVLLPFPKYIETHDHWIAITGNLMQVNLHLEEMTLKRRIHGNNVSLRKRSLYAKIYSRIILILQTVELLRRLKSYKGRSNK